MTSRVCLWGALSVVVVLLQHGTARGALNGGSSSDRMVSGGDDDYVDYSHRHQPESDNVIGDNNTLDSSVSSATDLGRANATEPPPPPRIVFSKSPLNASYLSKDHFNPRGMEHLYLITNTFLQIVHRDEEMPPELIALIEREVDKTTLDDVQAARVVQDLGDNWDEFLFHYIGLTSLLVIGLLTALLIPFVGLIFCCCRCSGRCGGNYPPYDKKRDPCKRALMGTILATLLVVLLLGLVCCYVTNARMEAGIEQLPDELDAAVSDTKLYLYNTKKEVETLTNKNFDELRTVLFNKLEQSGVLINGELARVSKAIAISNLTAIATSVTLIKKDLQVIHNVTIKLQKETSNLRIGLKDVGQRLAILRSACESVPQCVSLIDNYAGKLEISNQFNKYLKADIMPQLPDLKDKIREVRELIDNGIVRQVTRGNRDLESIAHVIQGRVQKSLPQIRDQINNKGKDLQNAAKKLGKMMDKIDTEVASQYIATSRHYINEYSLYRYWFFFLICTMLLLIIFCFTMGIVFGCCGRRPDEATSCYKNTGASWLMWGVGLTFLFGVVIMLTTTCLFFMGSVFELMVCDPLRDPTHSEVFSLVASQLSSEKYFPNGDAPQFAQVIERCHQNGSMFAVLDMNSLDSMIENFSNYREFLNLREKTDQIKHDIGQSIDTSVQILSKDAKLQLQTLANTSIANKDTWYNYTMRLERNVLDIDLLDLAAQLNETADNLPSKYHVVSVKLKNEAIFLEGLRRWLSSIKANIRLLNLTTENLSERLKFNKTSLKIAIKDLIEQAEYAQQYLQINGSKEIVQLVDRFSEDFLDDIDAYVEHVMTNLWDNVGKCGPMSTVYNTTTSAVCRSIIYPFNGFWASVGWCFLFFIPSLFLSVKLAVLYRKTEPYSGPLTESHESMYDAYAERDNIPLTSGDKKQNRRSRDCDNTRIASSYSTEPYAAQPCSPPRIDYPPNSDWAEYPPSGGPPRYTSQPSLTPEYERPPPYYYPGPGNV